MDANQRWDVGEAISYMKQLAKFKPVWIEEPTSPDDVLGEWMYRDWCSWPVWLLTSLGGNVVCETAMGIFGYLQLRTK